MRLRLIVSGKALRQGWSRANFQQNAGIKHSRAFSFNSSCRCNHGRQYDLKRPSGGFAFGQQPSTLMLLNTYTVSQRHFARGRDEDDEDVFDDVESRLLREDSEGNDTRMGTSSYGMGSADFDYDWAQGGDGAEVEGEEGDSDEEEGSDIEGDEEDDEEDDEEGLEADSDEDSEAETANEQSDEEFEDEKTDEELDELLAQTPLFDPPDIEFLRPDAPLPEFSFRPEGPVYYPGMEYEPEELDVTRPLPPRKREAKIKEEVSVEEVIDNADFRNVRYLTRFIDETGNIIARKEFKMRNKSHNRIVRAIKTARFFGLMPYTNMGRPKFVFNEPFDEFSEFYETDDDEKTYDSASNAANFQSRFNNIHRDGGFRGQGQGGFSGQGAFNSQNSWGGRFQ